MRFSPRKFALSLPSAERTFQIANQSAITLARLPRSTNSKLELFRRQSLSVSARKLFEANSGKPELFGTKWDKIELWSFCK